MRLVEQTFLMQLSLASSSANLPITEIKFIQLDSLLLMDSSVYVRHTHSTQFHPHQLVSFLSKESLGITNQGSASTRQAMISSSSSLSSATVPGCKAIYYLYFCYTQFSVHRPSLLRCSLVVSSCPVSDVSLLALCLLISWSPSSLRVDANAIARSEDAASQTERSQLSEPYSYDDFCWSV